MEISKENILEKIFGLIAHSESSAHTLDQIVKYVAKTYQIDVCSVYILDPNKKELVLEATEGLSKELVGIISMKANQGLTGLVLETMSPVFIVNPSDHSRYKYYKKSGEEIYHTFLGLPLLYQQNLLGIMVIQTIDKNTISKNDIPLFSNLSAQISSIVAYTGILKDLKGKKKLKGSGVLDSLSAEEKKYVQGISVGSGFAKGHAYYLKNSIGFDQIEKKISLDSDNEISRLEAAFAKGAYDIKQVIIKKTASSSGEESSILEAHLMYLKDRSFKNRIINIIKDGNSAEFALKMEVLSKIEFFKSLDDPYLRERGADIEDIGKRVLCHLMGFSIPDIRKFNRDTILMASDLSPVDLINLNQLNLKGIVLSKGGKTSHTIILAKSFEIPVVIGVKGLLKVIKHNDFVIMDASSGIIFKNPPAEIQNEYIRIEKEKIKKFDQLNIIKDRQAITKDGHMVQLGANIGLISDMDLMEKYGADCIGLYRTEFPFLIRKSFPTENEQFNLYRRVLEKAGGKEMTIRTIDVGGDKLLPYFDYQKEDNPFLGWRSIRISLDMEDIFREQIRAILKASFYGNIRILFPMITTVSELKKIIEILNQEKARLKKAGIKINENIDTGIMVEVPAAAIILNRLIDHVDFVSIGTNDLVQYILAVDRNNEKVAHLYTPFHPAVISTIYEIVITCNKKNKPVCICGEAASNNYLVALFVAMGVKFLSMNSVSIPHVKNFILGIERKRLNHILKKVLTMDTSDEISEYLKEVLFPELHQLNAKL